MLLLVWNMILKQCGLSLLISSSYSHGHNGRPERLRHRVNRARWGTAITLYVTLHVLMMDVQSHKLRGLLAESFVNSALGTSCAGSATPTRRVGAGGPEGLSAQHTCQRPYTGRALPLDADETASMAKAHGRTRQYIPSSSGYSSEI